MTVTASFIEIPHHLQDAIINSVTPINVAGLETENKLLMAAIEKARTRLYETSLTLYQLALTALKDVVVGLRVRVMFSDERLNYILDQAVWNAEGDKVLIPAPTNLGASFFVHNGSKAPYVLTMQGRARQVILDGRTLDLGLNAAERVTLPIEGMPQPDSGAYTPQSLTLHTLEISNVSDSLLPDVQLQMIRIFRTTIQTAMNEGRTHSVN